MWGRGSSLEANRCEERRISGLGHVTHNPSYLRLMEKVHLHVYLCSWRYPNKYLLHTACLQVFLSVVFSTLVLLSAACHRLCFCSLCAVTPKIRIVDGEGSGPYMALRWKYSRLSGQMESDMTLFVVHDSRRSLNWPSPKFCPRSLERSPKRQMHFRPSKCFTPACLLPFHGTSDTGRKC